ncbi:unnamed protein product [Polarella glacialis]|uniref:Uncharacterized protein n=1 Tax=Polarella glacialis TaxID=89957 RepID=A0A813KIJ4_POLGL|nr:unnamed protein product [Polarella glacialis]
MKHGSAVKRWELNPQTGLQRYRRAPRGKNLPSLRAASQRRALMIHWLELHLSVCEAKGGPEPILLSAKKELPSSSQQPSRRGSWTLPIFQMMPWPNPQLHPLSKCVCWARNREAATWLRFCDLNLLFSEILPGSTACVWRFACEPPFPFNGSLNRLRGLTPGDTVPPEGSKDVDANKCLAS